MGGVLIPSAAGAGGDVDLAPIEGRLSDVEDLVPRVAAVETTLEDVPTTTQVEELIAGNASSSIRVWEAGELAWTHNFDAPFGSGPTALFEATGGWGPGAVAIDVAANAPSVGRPAYSNFAKFGSTDGGAPQLFLYIDRVPELAGKSPVLIKCWAKVNGGANFKIIQSGVTKTQISGGGAPGTTAWTHMTAALNGELDGNDYITFYDDRYSEAWLGGLEVYVESDNPFMLNDLCIYDNQVYQSKVDNNAATPGDDATWEVVLVQTSISDLEARVAALEGA